MARKQRVIMLADCQSFYASVEKAKHPEYEGKPLVVAGDPERRSGIVLAACPLAKARGVTTAERLGEALGKCPDLIVAKPRMQEYIEYSLLITRIYESFTDMVEPYSIDEQFLDLTGSPRLFGGPEEAARRIQKQVLEQTGVYVRLGISTNKVLAKMACDNYAKKHPTGIFRLDPGRLEQTLWQLPVGKMFMIGSRMTAHLNRMGIETIGDLARAPLSRLRARWGINGEMIWRIARGCDDSPVTPDTHIGQKGIGHQMTLPRDYETREELRVVLLELCELVCRRMRAKGKMGRTLAVGCQGADFDRPSGFFRQMTLPYPTQATNDAYRFACELLDRHWDGLPVRKVGVAMTGLQDDREYQLLLFDHREKYRALERATDRIKDKYGDDSIMRAVSLTEAGQAKDRARKIGGHYK